MSIIWREREHSDVDNEVLEDQESLYGLKNYGLLKFLMMPSMRGQNRLLEMLIHYWDLEKEKFVIDQIHLQVRLEDIYFIIGLSRRGEVVDLKGKEMEALMLLNTFLCIVHQGLTKLVHKS